METKIDLSVLYSDISKLYDRLKNIDVIHLNEEDTLQQISDDIEVLHIRLNRSFFDMKDGYDRFNNTETETRWRNIRKVWTIVEFNLNKINIEKEKNPH